MNTERNHYEDNGSLPMYIVDAFADQAFAGNPAAVCFPDTELDDRLMARIAAEMNLSETAFLRPETDGYRLRWFTPAAEVDLCGHATLAAAKVLWTTGRLAAGEPAHFYTRSGLLVAEGTEEGITLYFPAYAPVSAAAPEGLAEALGLPQEQILEVMAYGGNGKIRPSLLVRINSEQAVRALLPDPAALLRLPYRAFAVTAQAETEGIDIVSRFFAPSVGVNEDPVTGSAHTALAPYWGERLGRERLNAYQASPRGGTLRLTLSSGRVRLSGQAAIMLNGRFFPEGMPG